MIIAEAIFNTKIRYGISVYISPVFEDEDLKMKKISKNTSTLQTLQNIMIRLIFGFKKKQHINMQTVREKIGMMSVNQMAIYHTLLEAHNIVKKSASEQIKVKWEDKKENKYGLRSSVKNELKIPNKPSNKSTGFTYYAPKLFNMLPSDIKETENSQTFKALIKKWIWQKIPSY